MIAAVVHFARGAPIAQWWLSAIWVLTLAAAAFLMVSTWRFYSFKELDFRARRPARIIVLLGLVIAGIVFFLTSCCL